MKMDEERKSEWPLMITKFEHIGQTHIYKKIVPPMANW